MEIEKDEDLVFLENVVKQNEIDIEKNKAFRVEVNKSRGIILSNTPSIMSMDKKFFSYKREMKQLFADSATQFGAVGRDNINPNEERKRNLNDEME